MNRKGFTLIELLVVIGITILIFSMGIASFNRFNRRQRLVQAALTLKSALRFTHTKSVSADKPNTAEDCSPQSLPCCTTYDGVAVSFTASSYSTRHTCDPEGAVGPTTTVTLPSGITFSSVPASFTYLRTNETDLASTRTLTLTDGSESYVLTVLTNGTVNDQGI